MRMFYRLIINPKTNSDIEDKKTRLRPIPAFKLVKRKILKISGYNSSGSRS